MKNTIQLLNFFTEEQREPEWECKQVRFVSVGDSSPHFVSWSIMRGPIAVLPSTQCVLGSIKHLLDATTEFPQEETHMHTHEHACTLLFVRFKHVSREPGEEQA